MSSNTPTSSALKRYQKAYDEVWHPDIPKNNDYFDLAPQMLESRLQNNGLVNKQDFLALLTSPEAKMPEHAEMLHMLVAHMRQKHPEVITEEAATAVLDQQSDVKTFARFASDIAQKGGTHHAFLSARLPSDPNSYFRDEKARANKETFLLIDTKEGPRMFCTVDRGGHHDRFEGVKPMEIPEGFIALRQRKGHSNGGEYMAAISKVVELTHQAAQINKAEPARFQGAKPAWDELISVINSQPSAIKKRLKNSAQRLLDSAEIKR